MVYENLSLRRDLISEGINGTLHCTVKKVVSAMPLKHNTIFEMLELLILI
jgi:hypothetical protein